MTSLNLVEPRRYRDYGPSDRFVTFHVAVETSDLYVRAHRSLEVETERLIRVARTQVEDAIARRPEFLTSFVPLDEQPEDAPLPGRMVRAGKKAGTGPMAAVAGAVAEFVGQGLLKLSPEVIVENGGDIFLRIDYPVVVGLFAGESPFSNRVGLRVNPSVLPLGLCTSSGSVGPSYSAGRADAATILSRDAVLADAVATALGNRIAAARDLKPAVEWAMSVPGVDGALAIIGDKIAAMGDLELVAL
jgi:ApbE superfamily uncharacterized protein (UPF0280 family)